MACPTDPLTQSPHPPLLHRDGADIQLRDLMADGLGNMGRNLTPHLVDKVGVNWMHLDNVACRERATEVRCGDSGCVVFAFCHS